MTTRNTAWAPWLARIVACAALALAGGCAHPAGRTPAATAWRVGPLLEGGTRDDGSTVTAVRPVFSHAADSNRTHTVTDVLWPFGTYRVNENRSWWRFFPASGADADIDDPASPYALRVLPIYFEGRSRAGEEYRAIFPLGGTICDFPTIDRARFFLFPLYGDSRRGDEHSMSLLWPIFAKGRGPNSSHWRFFPFYGEAHRTGQFAEDRRFVLWPIWNDVHYEGKRAKGDGFVLFPIYGQTDLGCERTWMVLPPLFSYTRGDEGYRLLRCPWPLVKIEDREDERTRTFWPVFSRKVMPDRTKWYALWPFVTGQRVDRGGQVVSRLNVVPVYYHLFRTPSDDPDDAALAATAVTESYRRVWPLFSVDRNAQRSRTRVPELTLFGKSEVVERNWAPLWSLYVRERQADGATRSDLLWGLASWGRCAGRGRYLRLAGCRVFGRASSPAPTAGEGLP